MMKYKIGDIINGQVTGIEKYGIFLSIDNEYTGLIHISEISDGFVRNVSDYVNPGDKIYARIIDIDEENSKLKLSIKNIDYKHNKKISNVIDFAKGFDPLKERLQSWIDDKLEEIRKQSSK